mmetsp:Transcript_19623/g.25418  ORF Transcript_19623/g.25418 Transcript_19623/m.25418 type:complete len:92 (+) Transcript_19623:110-385(+)|eukprot:CAMPEP_0116054268 /NCGR_PEP_ID=MMETSP0322-20121206/2688_1 /TAXON_ID=163516 /ORGANISM="Leptocylindrus danicus var. apora, Strain B651" /LENGTH=91 /DNA_ID=CAMNT_0003537603 /DNA_START=85 /DNA_END=360 /DNA_ORIENTATION=-
MGNTPSSDEQKPQQSNIQGQQLRRNPRLRDSRGIQPSAFNTACKAEHEASLRCIEENYTSKDMVCTRFFDEYKKCKQAESERIRNARGDGW